jgi:hypothetical protein
VIHAFFDDSGSERDPSSRFPCLAGYLAHETYWYTFLESWRNLLLQHAMNGLHMRTFIRLAQERGWGTVTRHKVILQFVQAVKEARLIGFGVGVDANVWRSLPRAQRSSFGNAQEFCFQRIVRRVTDRLERSNEREPIQLYFDRDMEYARPRISQFDSILKFDRAAAARIAAISFADTKWFLPLQAADLLAWETRKALIARADRDPRSPRLNEMLEALPFVDMDYEGEFWDEEEVRKYFPAVEEERRAAIAAARGNKTP